MPERYPDDATLLALSEDATTGVEYIPTGRSPYYLEFRRLVQRLALAGQRANDLRVYQDGDLTVGVRPGRCFIANTPLQYAGMTGASVDADATTHLWLDTTGTLQTGTSGLPADRSTFVPLAEVIAGASTITSITDLRGEAMLHISSTAMLGLTASAAEINQALDGINATVDVAAMNTLTAGPTSTADTEHRHLQVLQATDDVVYFTLKNTSAGGNANVALALSLPNVLQDNLLLLPNLDNGFLSQAYDGATYNMVGVVHVQFVYPGNLTASQTGKLIGVVPIDGVVTDVILSVGTNIVSSTGSDGLSAAAKVNGVTLTSTSPALTSNDGSGFRCTDQGDGVAAVVKTDGTQNVLRGDVLTLDITRTASGTVSTEATDVVVMVVIRADRPE